jgi:hypothetical protein
MIISDINDTKAAINAKIPYMDAVTLVYDVGLTDLISLIFTIYLTSKIFYFGVPKAYGLLITSKNSVFGPQNYKFEKKYLVFFLTPKNLRFLGIL